MRMHDATTPVSATLRELVRDVDPNLSVRSIVRLEDQIASPSASRSPRRPPAS
jgi:hypothetical protein